MKAVIFIDVQNDFVKHGKLAYGYPTNDVVPNIINFAKECRAKGYMLYATADTHNKTIYDNYATPNVAFQPEPKPISGYLTTFEGQRLPIEHCIKGTLGHKIVNGLVKDDQRNVIIPQGHIVDKPTFGSFDLLARIDQDFVVDDNGNTTAMSKYDGIGEPLDEIIICGFCLSICVMANAIMLRAKYPSVKITIKKDLCGDVDKEAFDAAVKVLQMQQIDVV